MTGQRGRLEKLMPDKTGLSDMSLSSAPALPAGRIVQWGRSPYLIRC